MVFYVTDTDINEHKAIIDFLLSATETSSYFLGQFSPGSWVYVCVSRVLSHFTDEEMEIQGVNCALE